MMIINKLADIQDLNQIARCCVIERLLKTRYIIEQSGLPYSKHMQDNWLRLWEYSGAIIESHLDKRMRVLDAGGTGTILSYYMALEGCEVHTVDLDEQKVIDADNLAEHFGLKMFNSVNRIERIDYPDSFFDAVYLICVIEHIGKDMQSLAIKQLARALKPGGVLSLTLDYGKDGADNPFLSRKDIDERLITPSKLEVCDNATFSACSSDLRYTDMDNTFGSLFLKKPGVLALRVGEPPPIKTPLLIDLYSKNIIIDYYKEICKCHSQG